MVSKIYLIRHGITEGNEKRWYYGGADLPLTEGGKQTLRALAEKGVYPRLPEDADLYTTGLARTEETCEILFGQREHRVIRNLREMEMCIRDSVDPEEISGPSPAADLLCRHCHRVPKACEGLGRDNFICGQFQRSRKPAGNFAVRPFADGGRSIFVRQRGEEKCFVNCGGTVAGRVCWRWPC